MNLQDEIAKVAYELYEKGGRIDGKDVKDWLEAEKIIKGRVGGAMGPRVEVVMEGTAEHSKTMAKRTQRPNPV